jgi:hypothetical protein
MYKFGYGSMINSIEVNAMKKCSLLLGLCVVMFLGLTNCAVVTTQWYEGQGKPANETAIIETGPYTNIEAIDGKTVNALRIAVLPGTYQVSIKPGEPDQQPLSPYLFYSRVTGSISFTAQAGHTYMVYVKFLTEQKPADEIRGSGFVWIAYILDRSVDKKIAQTDPLPLEAEHRGWPTGLSIPSNIYVP